MKAITPKRGKLCVLAGLCAAALLTGCSTVSQQANDPTLPTVGQVFLEGTGS